MSPATCSPECASLAERFLCNRILHKKAEPFGNWHLVKGGIDAWENAEDGILIVNKDLFDQYADRLTGHVIMYDNNYLYFLHDMY